MPAGRPSKYTPEYTDKILEAVRLGAPLTHACNYAGVHFDTFNEWRKIHPEFSVAVKEAEASMVKTCLSQIDTAATNGNWQAAAWRLERRYPHEFGRRDRMPIDEHELQRQFEAEMAGIESGRETSIPAGAESNAVN